MEVNPLICGFLRGCERTELGLPEDNCTQIYQVLHIVRSFRIRSISFKVGAVGLGSLDSGKAKGYP